MELLFSTVVNINSYSNFMCDKNFWSILTSGGMWMVLFIIQCSSSLLYFREIAVRYFPVEPFLLLHPLTNFQFPYFCVMSCTPNV